jgi:GAF domain-containing protein
LKETASFWVKERRRTHIAKDLAEKREFPVDKRNLKEGFRSAIRVPLFFKNEVFGTLNLSSRRPNAYGESGREILEGLAGQIGGAIKNAQLYEKERQERVELESQEKRRVEFMRTVTHELKTPLISIIGSS